MNRIAAMWRIGVVALAGWAIGCNRTGGSSATPGAQTPRQAVTNIARAAETGDETLFLHSVHIPPGREAMARRAFAVMVEAARLQQDVLKAFGSEALSRMQGLQAVAPPIPTSEEVAQRVEVTALDDDHALAVMPDSDEDIQLIRKDGRWYVDMAEGMPDADNEDRALRILAAMAQALGNVRRQVGQPGMTPEKLDEAMDQAMGEALAPILSDLQEGAAPPASAPGTAP